MGNRARQNGAIALDAICMFLASNQAHLHLAEQFALHRALATRAMHCQYAAMAVRNVRSCPVQQLRVKKDTGPGVQFDDDLVRVARFVPSA